jgi:rhamnosyltransferase
MRRILAVIVTHHPEVPHLNALVDTLLNQVDALVIIDNNTPEFDRKSIRSSSVKIDLIRNENNLGLATAYNQGCLIATQGNFSHIPIPGYAACKSIPFLRSRSWAEIF